MFTVVHHDDDDDDECIFVVLTTMNITVGNKYDFYDGICHTE
jgi:hypothetical protein